jgi:hypothetical protein
MPLTLRPTGLSSPAYRDLLDYVIVEDRRDVGRLYEDRPQQARAAVVLVDHGVRQSGTVLIPGSSALKSTGVVISRPE